MMRKTSHQLIKQLYCGKAMRVGVVRTSKREMGKGRRRERGGKREKGKREKGKREDGGEREEGGGKERRECNAKKKESIKDTEK